MKTCETADQASEDYFPGGQMRKIGLWILFLIFSVNAFSADFTLTHLSQGQPSEDRFPFFWELMDDLVFYATFKDGVWTHPVEVPFPAPYEGFQISLDIRSDDELVLVVTCQSH